MTPLETIALDTISEIERFKKESGTEPALSTIDEMLISLKPELLEAVRSLYKQNRVIFRKTINGIPMFGIKQ